MKSIINSFVILSFFLVLALSAWNLINLKKQIKILELNNLGLIKESDLYINSLSSKNFLFDVSAINYLNNNVINDKKNNYPTLFYFFSSSDCKSCAEQIIFHLLKIIQKNKGINVRVISTIDQENYLSLLSKVHSNKNLSFGILENIKFNKSCFFLQYNSNEFSNSFIVPEDINFVEKYLNRITNKLKTK